MINAKIRSALDRLKWPLVTRARYQQNKDNYEEEIRQMNKEAASLRVLLRDAKRVIEERHLTIAGPINDE